MFRFEPIRPFAVPVGTQVGVRFLGQQHEVLQVPTPEHPPVRTLLQSFECVLADCLQHREARLAVAVLRLAEQALLDQRHQPLENLTAAQLAIGVTDGLGRLDPAATDEHPEPREQRLLPRREQLVAPGDRRPQCPLAHLQILCPAGQ